MNTVDLICIGCPMGCMIKVEMEGKEVVSVTGNTCKRGDKYARAEVTNPSRTVTSTVKVDGGSLPVVSVKTQSDISKGLIIKCMEEINKVTIKAPVAIGDVVLKNVCGTGVDVVATKNISVA